MRTLGLVLTVCVACGSGLPSAPASSPTGGQGVDRRPPGAVAAQLLRLLNQERKRAGLPPLRRHGKLDRAARVHSRDMAKHRFVGHDSPRTGAPAQRVERTGAVATVVRENVAMAYSTRELHDGWMDSRGHRENILSPEVRQVGIAVVPRSEGGVRMLFATQVFARIAPPLDPSAAPRLALRKLQALRKASGVAALRTHRGMAAAAARIARRLRKASEREREHLLQQALSGVTPPRGARSLSAATPSTPSS